MLKPLTETRPYIITKGNKQGWRVWTFRYTFITKNRNVRYKYTMAKSGFDTQLEAERWGHNYTFKPWRTLKNY